MKLTIRGEEDWYVIERAEHDGHKWLERDKEHASVFALRCSSRFSDADVEGTAAQMVGIAEAIERRGSIRYKRCAVDASRDPVTFSSPRNSQQDGECAVAEAIELAAEIRRMFPGVSAAEEGYY